MQRQSQGRKKVVWDVSHVDTGPRKEAQGNGTTQMATSSAQGLKQEVGEPQKLTFFLC